MSFLGFSARQQQIQITDQMPKLAQPEFFDKEAFLFICPNPECRVGNYIPRTLETTLFGLHLLRLSPDPKFYELVENALCSYWDKEVYAATGFDLEQEFISFDRIALLFDYPQIRSDIYFFKLRILRDRGGIHPFVYITWASHGQSVQYYSDLPIPQYLEHFKKFAFECDTCGELWDIQNGRFVSYRE